MGILSYEKIIKFVIWSLFLFALMLFSTLISMKIILKGDIVRVPDLKGKSIEEAREELAQIGLYLVQKSIQFSMNIPAGKIMDQEPEPGSKIKRNKEVKVIISAGKEKVKMPDLIGKDLEIAESILKELNLKRGLVVQTHSSRYSAGRIIAQTPEKGLEVESGTPVSLLVSQGQEEEKFIMPDLIGKKLDLTILMLNKLGFKIGIIRYTHYPGLEPGIIIKQLPLSGYRVYKSNLISLEVSK
jgi:serine/threonine-protein kinase